MTLTSESLAARLDALNIPATVEVELAVKTQTAPTISAGALALKQLGRPIILGHNRVQEAVATIPQVRTDLAAAGIGTAATGPGGVEVNLIGVLQRNKINAALGVITGVESVASQRLIAALAARAPAGFPVWIQVNISGEQSKAGCEPQQTPTLIAAAHTAGLQVCGLMTVGLNSTDLEAVGRGYNQLRALRDAYLPGGGLSMGMSRDWRLAIDCGATRVRLGQSLFGQRPVR